MFRITDVSNSMLQWRLIDKKIMISKRLISLKKVDLHSKKYFVFVLKLVLVKIFDIEFLTYPSVNLT